MIAVLLHLQGESMESEDAPPCKKRDQGKEVLTESKTEEVGCARRLFPYIGCRTALLQICALNSTPVSLWE